MIADCFKRESIEVELSNNRLKCGNHVSSIPKYMHVKTLLNTLLDESKVHKKHYYMLMSRMVCGEKVNVEEYNETVNSIMTLEKHIQKLAQEQYEQNHDVVALRELIDDIASQEQELLSTKSPFDATLSKQLAKLHKDKVKAFNKLSEGKEHIWKEYIEDGIAEEPKKRSSVMKPNKKAVVAAPRQAPAIAPAPSKPKKTVKKKANTNLTEPQKEDIKGRIKGILKDVYKFKDKQECISKQRSQPYFMSKEAILEEIEKNQELKKLMPTNYKSLTKEQLCTYFFE